MRIYLLADLEGVAGVLDLENWCRRESRYRERAGELLTGEVNAAVDGFLAGGATEIVVVDGHGGGGRGVNTSQLHPKAELVCKGAAGISSGDYCRFLNLCPFDVAACVGQYPKAGTVKGHLCHTTGHGVRDFSINGISIGDFGKNVLCAGELGIRYIFASGCEALTKEAKALVPGIETVAVKKGLQTDPGHSLPFEAYQNHNISAAHLSPKEARQRIRDGAQRTLERAKKEDFGLVRLKPPYETIQVFRSEATRAPYVVRRTHPTSVIGVFNTEGNVENIDADPLKLVRKKPPK